MKILLLIMAGLVTVLAQESTLLKEFFAGNAQFSADVYKELTKYNSGNFLVCPLSLEVILALVHDGARGNTALQLSEGLHLPEDREQVKKIFYTLAPRLQGGENYNLTSANKIYVKDHFEISNDFRSTAVNIFDAEIQNVDFLKKEEAAAQMNRWVENKTHDKIKDVVSPDDLHEDTRLVLINAMYFHGKWARPFDEDFTERAPFYTNDQIVSEVDMMETTDDFYYYESPELDAKFLEMPYEGEDITMTIVLPNDKEGLPDLEDQIAEVFSVSSYDLQRVHVELPKFKIETTIQFNPILQALGIVDAFDQNADLSGIGGHQEQLQISKVIQKAFIEVEEKGTTAAAASAVFAVERSGHFLQPPPKQFIANHPFIYFLRSRFAGILFVGRFVQG